MFTSCSSSSFALECRVAARGVFAVPSGQYAFTLFELQPVKKKVFDALKYLTFSFKEVEIGCSVLFMRHNSDCALGLLRRRPTTDGGNG